MTRLLAADRILSRLEIFGTRLGLATTRRLLEALGRPSKRFAPVLVAGSNGKGSTAALLAAMGTAAGYRTGLFTSPHLETVTERIRIDQQAIPDAELADLLAELTRLAERETGDPATYFETVFVAACVWYAQHGVDLAVLEVGMGGRLDATNACDPVASIVTGIALEHQQYLGQTVSEIAREKAGIFRSGCPAVIGETARPVAKLLLELAQDLGARSIWAPAAVQVVAVDERDDWSQSLQLRSPTSDYETTLGLPGPHQQLNAVTAVAAAEALAADGWSLFDRRAVERGISGCVWPGRLERVVTAEGRLVILDAAHNPQASGLLANFLARRLDRWTLVFAVLKDKDAASMLEALVPGAESVILTRVSTPRARDPFELLDLVPDRAARVIENPRQALQAALAQEEPVLVTGSLYLVGELRAELRKRGEISE